MTTQVDCWSPSGRLVMANAADARNEVLEQINRGDGHLVIDLGEVSFMDSSGLSVLISALKAVQLRQGKIALCGLNANLRALVELTRLHQVFTIYPDRATAIQQLLA